MDTETEYEPESALPTGEFTITAELTDTEIDALVLAALMRRARRLDDLIEAKGEERRLHWSAELHQLRDGRGPDGEAWHEQHYLSREVPFHGRSTVRKPTRITAETSNAAITLIADGAVERWCADQRAARRHLLAGYADRWTAELRRLRDQQLGG